MLSSDAYTVIAEVVGPTKVGKQIAMEFLVT